ncbi:MAG: HesA/MoeB/ThiF family protein [Desulfobacterales bacterium]|nr:HesA/MoeB/ThiF family protein [Desulfobacterales bacterium]
MSRKPQKELDQLIQTSSIMVADPAGREAIVLDDDHALEIADKCSRAVHEVYTEALRLGISPYRYIRNREVITVQDQLRLAESKVAIVGAGGLGGQVILLLARAGIGHLTVVDCDLFDETNLNRQSLCNRESLGRPKPQVAVEVVGSINPGVEVIPHQMRLNSTNGPDILVGSDVVVDALDNIPSRLALERTTKELGVPLVHGALAGFEGWMMTIFPDDQGLKLLYGDEEAKGDNAKSPEAILGIPALTPSIIATLQATEVLKIILGREKIFRHIMVHVDLERGELNEFVCENCSSLESS